MYYKRIFNKALSHYSYIIGDEKDLIVIDPQADIGLYMDIARQEEKQIRYILETHRNEDFLVGSRALADLTGARVFISAYEDLGYSYGEKIEEGHIIKLNNIKIKAIHTPGHTLGHMSYLLYFKERPYMIFLGDCCFYGDLGRVDFYGEDKIGEMAGKLYDSIFNKILPLGDDIIMCPAHGAGSACGEDTEDRPLSSLGHERKYNPRLQFTNKEDFIRANSKILFKPDYFTYMEEKNLQGVDPIDINPYIGMKDLEDLDFENEWILDIRNQIDYNNSHIPNSIYINKKNMISFINWLVDRESNITLVAEKEYDLKEILINLRRIGYNREINFLRNGIFAWSKVKKSESLAMVSIKEFKQNMKDFFILDVRRESEVDVQYGDKGIIVPLESIRHDYKKLKDKKNILVVCPTGVRSNMAASFLKSKGIESQVLLGGLSLL